MSFVGPALLLLVGLLYGDPAQAYLDPGTGSLVLQVVLAGIAGALAVVKLYWEKIRGLFRPQVGSEPSPLPDSRAESGSEK